MTKGYYDKDTNAPTVDVDTGASDFVGMWHAHPPGTGPGELFGHIGEITGTPALKTIFTTVGHDLYQQWIDNGNVLPAWNESKFPPIPALCTGCIP